LGIIPFPWIMPPRDAIAPICMRTSFWTSPNSSSEGTADSGWSAVESVTNAKGRCPFRASGMPTTQHSAIVGWEEIACSIEPGED
jgi:hypothetical protein